MRHETIARHADEPCFEMPPRLTAGVERRLTMRVANLGATPHEFCDTAVTLVFGDAAVSVTAVGSAVAAAFGLVVGRLDGAPDDLAGRLLGACAALRASGAVVAFEAAVPSQTAACVLLRGVLLPTQQGAEAVLSWKQVLDDDATTRLRAELLRAFVAPRAATVDAFAR